MSSTLGKFAFLAVGLLFIGFILRNVDLTFWLDPQQLVTFIESAGSLAPLLFMGMMASAVIVSPIPSWPLDVAAGLVFGSWLGTLYAAIGASVGGVVGFLIARRLGRDAIKRWLDPDAFLCTDCDNKVLGRAILVMRLIPGFSFDLVSYAAGLTSVSLRTFALATFFGALPPTYLLVSAGREIFLTEDMTGKIIAAVVMGLVLLSPFVLRRFGWLGPMRPATEKLENQKQESLVERQCRACKRWFQVSTSRLAPIAASMIGVLVIGVFVALVL